MSPFEATPPDERSPRERSWRVLWAPALAILTVEIFRRSGLYDPETYSLVLIVPIVAVLYVSFVGDFRAALVSTGAIILYNGVLATGPDIPFLSDRWVRRVVVIGVSLPLASVLMGRLRQQAERLESRFRLIAENIHEVLWLATADLGEVLYVNPAYEEIWGQPVDVILRNPGARLEVALPGDRARVQEEIRRRLPFGEYDVEYRILHPSGAVRWVRERAIAIRDDKGQIYRIVGLTEDITERKTREEEQRCLAEVGKVLAGSRRYEETLAAIARLAVRHVADWVNIDVLEDGRIRRIAIAHADPEKERLAREMFRRWPPDSRAPFGAAKVIRTGRAELIPEIQDRVLRGIAHDAEQLEMLRRLGMRSAMLVPLITRGRTVGAITFISAESGRIYNADDLVLAQELATRAALAMDNARLFELERQARADAEAARDEARRAAMRSAFLADLSTVLASSLDYRESLRELAHLSVPRFADWCIADLLEGGELERVEVAHRDPEDEGLARELLRNVPDVDSDSPIARAIATGRAELAEDVPAAWLDGTARPPDAAPTSLYRKRFRSVITAPLLARGHTLGVITLAVAESGRRYDADDLALAEEMARRAAVAVDNARLYHEALAANQAKSDFLAVMSHELRTPLNAILGYTDLMRMGVPEPLPASARAHVERITASARHLLELIDEVLSFSRIEAGREELRLQRVDSRESLRDVAAIAEPLAGEKGLRFRLQLPEGDADLVTDPAKLRQILLNLLSNAVKFTDQGEVTLAADADDDSVSFTVSDTGIGIAPEHQDRIFEAFWQVEQGATRRAEGTGLGLTVARRLARLLGGDITVESDPGRGSTFTVRLPRRRWRAG